MRLMAIKEEPSPSFSSSQGLYKVLNMFRELIRLALCTLSLVVCTAAFTAMLPATSKPYHQSTVVSCSAVILSGDDAETDTETSAWKANISRRLALAQSMALISPAFWAGQSTTVAAKSISPDEAYDNLVKGRDELIAAAKKYLPSRDMDGLRDYLEDEATNINNYEGNAQILLESKRLDVESKKEIGTIRRYGVGADVMIMYGGLRAEMVQDTPNFNEVQMYIVRTLDSLEEVIVICRNNGFGEV
jgi:hypothetical protein